MILNALNNHDAVMSESEPASAENEAAIPQGLRATISEKTPSACGDGTGVSGV